MKDNNLNELKKISHRLRAPGGCPWDREQTHDSLKKYLIEETYEAIDAIESGNDEEMLEELGDVLYQVYAHAEIAEEEGRFNLNDIAGRIAGKLVYRHPHVFADENIETSEEVLTRWEKLKKKEKDPSRSILDGIPRHLPALLKAYRVQEKTSRSGFDFSEIEETVSKLDEETAELKEVIADGDSERIFEEFGDILFSIVNIARFLKIDPEAALQQSVKKFTGRYKEVERRVFESGKEMSDFTMQELDSFWEEAKIKKDLSSDTP